MGKRARKNYRNVAVVGEDDFDDLFDDDFDAYELSRDIHSTQWGEDKSDSKISPRRKIERKRDMSKLYSELDEWEVFGKSPDYFV